MGDLSFRSSQGSGYVSIYDAPSLRERRYTPGPEAGQKTDASASRECRLSCPQPGVLP